MTTDPFAEALRRLAEDAVIDVQGADRCQALGIMPAAYQLHRRLRETALALPALLDALAAADHRATRAETQSETRRIDIDYWKETALQERAAALDALEQIKNRDARIKAVEDVHYPAQNSQDRTPFCPDCKGSPGVHECGCWRDDQETPVCGHCRGWKGVGPVEWPCPTIRALKG